MSKDHDALKEYKIGETGNVDCLEGARIPDVLWPKFFLTWGHALEPPLDKPPGAHGQRRCGSTGWLFLQEREG